MADLIEQDTGLEQRDEYEAGEAAAADLGDVLARALPRFDAIAEAQAEVRAQSLAARRFVTIPGAQWDDEWGESFPDAVKMEVNKVGRGVEKIERDYRENRIVPDFRPDGKDADSDTADTLDGLHRADSYRFKSQQARDNAVFEAITGGFGAYRLTTEWDDESDPQNDALRINPAALITDADQSVYFDLNAKLYDKSDARFAFVRVPMTRAAFEEEFEDATAVDWPENRLARVNDWFTPETVAVAEYYEVEKVKDTLWILTYTLSGEQRRLWASELEPGELAGFKADGWQTTKQRRSRCRVHKYILSGAEVLEDCGLIAGERIPIVPVYGKRYFVDGVERWKGHVQDKMDPQRLYNANISRLAETAMMAPREVPIFAAAQMDPSIDALWSQANSKRFPYLLVNPLIDEATGQIVSAGPIGSVKPADVPPTTAALIQIANNDLLEEQADGAEEVKANTSAEAMDIAATRIDAKSGIYLDNIRQSVQCEGEIYFGMAREVYAEEGREIETMTEDGDDGVAVLKSLKSDKTGDARVVNDFTNARYKVIVSVSEATATRRDKTVRSMLRTAEVANAAGDAELAQAAILTAILNQDGEGINEFQDFSRRRALAIGLVKPTEDEAKAAAEAEQAPVPDPMAELATAQAKDFLASAEKKLAEVPLTRAKTIETLAKAQAQGEPDQPVAPLPGA